MAPAPPRLDDIVDTLLRHPGRLARIPAAVLRSALPVEAAGRVSRSQGQGRGGGDKVGDYRIDDLARAASMTTRNVRAYQDRGLLPPPRRAGRVALYDDAHLARLKLIGSMLARGYTTAHIAEMLGAWESGKDLADVLGLEEALGSPWSDDQPVTMPTTEVRELAGDDASFERLVALQLVRVKGPKATVRRPALLRAFAEIRGFGLATSSLLDLYTDLQPGIDEIAHKLVLTAAEHITAVKGPRWVPTGDELGELTEMLQRLRHLATTTVQQSLAASMERTVEQVLGAYVAHLGDVGDGAVTEQAG